MSRLCTRGRAVLGIVGGGLTFGFLNGDAIPDENMPFFYTFMRSLGSLEIHTRFQTIMVKIISVF